MKATAWAPTVAMLLVAVLADRTVAASEPSPFSVEESKQGLLVREGDQRVFFYQRRAKSLDGKYERANYLHPVYDLRGNVLTEDFPADHRHHRGIFWAWHQVWVGDRKIGDPWEAKDFVWDVQKVETKSDAESAVLVAHVIWKSPQWTDADARPKPLVRETTTIQVHAATDQARMIDFEIRLLALEPNLRLGGSEDQKGYGGFSTRLRLPDDVTFVGRQGPVTPRTTAVDAGPWIDIRGSWAKPGEIDGVTILCHPSSPGFPQPWILRSSKSMQNPAYPGRSAVPLSTESPLVLRYRVVLHRGLVEPATIDAWQSAFAGNAEP